MQEGDQFISPQHVNAHVLTKTGNAAMGDARNHWILLAGAGRTVTSPYIMLVKSESGPRSFEVFVFVCCL